MYRLTQFKRISIGIHFLGKEGLLILLLVIAVFNSREWVDHTAPVVHNEQQKQNLSEVYQETKHYSENIFGSEVHPICKQKVVIPLAQRIAAVNIPSSYSYFSPITINNNTDFGVKASNFSWLGDGSPEMPYIIDNLNITGPYGYDILIDIRNTDVYFKITNCLLQHGERGIRLENVTHGYIYNNIIFNNTDYGIVLLGNSRFNTISTNLVNNSHAVEGITLDHSENNKLLSNIVCNGEAQGIYVTESNNTVVSSNYVYNNGEEGLVTWKSRNGTFTDNFIYNNSRDGIYLYESENNSIKNSIIFDNKRYGIQMQNSEHGILSNLNIYNNGRAGIKFWYSGHCKINNVNSTRNNHDYGYEEGNIIEYSGNSIFSKLNCSGNKGGGIKFSYSGNSTFSEIITSKNTGSGVYISSSGNSTLSDFVSFNNNGNGISLDDLRISSFHKSSTINNTYNGLQVVYSKNNTFTNINSSYNNENGISWNNVHNSILSSSNSYNNSKNGIELDDSRNNTLVTNNFYNNGNLSDYETNVFGIYLHYRSNECNVTSNSVFSNENGIGLRDMNNSIISYNIIYDNEGTGIEIDNSGGNILSNNIVYHNKGNGIYGYYWMESGYPLPENNIIRKNDFIENGYRWVYFYQSSCSGPGFQFDHNFWDNYRFPDENEDDVVDYPLKVGYEESGEVTQYNYDEFPQTQPNNPDSTIHYLTSPIITSPTCWDPANPEEWPQCLINGTVPIQWIQPLDTRGHTITYSLYYRGGGGWNEENWTEIASEITSTSYDWDTTNVIDGHYSLMITATCSHGLISSYKEEEGLFVIDNSPPVLTDAYASSVPFILILISVISLGVLESCKKKL